MNSTKTVEVDARMRHAADAVTVKRKEFTMKTIYQVQSDGFYSHIVKRNIDSMSKVDNQYYQFDSFSAAKKCLLSNLVSTRNEYNCALKYARSIKRDDIKYE